MLAGPTQCCEPCFVIDLVTESWRINNGQRYASAFLIKLELCIPLAHETQKLVVGVSLTNGDWLDSDTLLNVRAVWVVRVFALKHSLSAQGIYEGSAACVDSKSAPGAGAEVDRVIHTCS